MLMDRHQCLIHQQKSKRQTLAPGKQKVMACMNATEMQATPSESGREDDHLLKPGA